MGCDIHLNAEIKIEGQWHHYQDFDLWRNYDLFARMANVRNNGTITPLALPRGLQDDMSPVTRLDCQKWHTDGHSHSWLNADEIAELMKWIQERGWKPSSPLQPDWITESFGDCLGRHWARVLDPDDLPQGVEDVRFVFWFDN